nr:MAG TPA: hypothetical protein [Bacteriophage sp.]
MLSETSPSASPSGSLRRELGWQYCHKLSEVTKHTLW